MSPTYHPRVPHWVRLSAVSLGYFSPFKQIGAKCYEWHLRKAALSLSSRLPLVEIAVRGSRPDKSFHPGLSDIDLILIAEEDSLAQSVRNTTKARNIIGDMRKGWHPLGEAIWITEKEKTTLLEFCDKYTNIFGCRFFREGKWHTRPIRHDFSIAQFERALESYLAGFSFWLAGQQKKDPHSITFSHIRKSWQETLKFLNETGIENNKAIEFQRHPPDLNLLGELCALCARGLEVALINLRDRNKAVQNWTPQLTLVLDVGWITAHQKYIHAKYTELVDKSHAIELNAGDPLHFATSLNQLTGRRVAAYFKIVMQESLALRHAFLFPLLPTNLSHYFIGRLLPRIQNRRYLYGASNQWTPMQDVEWQHLACEGIFQVAGSLLASGETEPESDFSRFLVRFEECPNVPRSVLESALHTALSSKIALHREVMDKNKRQAL